MAIAAGGAMKRRAWRRAGFSLSLVVLLAWGCGPRRRDEIVVGSKNFTESALLGEILAQQIEHKTHLHVVREFYLAGSFICQQAMLAGRIDTYVEYTGTALTAILHEPIQSDRAAVYERVKREYEKRFQFRVMPPLGFDNTFAMVVRGEDARRLGLRTISDAAKYAPEWRAGFGYEFMERPDGYAGLAQMYGLHFREQPEILDLGLLYRALLDKNVDIVAGNSTDGLLAARDLTVLVDDRNYFPPYEATPVIREQAIALHPEAAAAIEELAGKISNEEMRKMNYEVDGERRDASVVAEEFLKEKGLE
jgi:osmoprotectant transport system substrate-binding protein